MNGRIRTLLAALSVIGWLGVALVPTASFANDVRPSPDGSPQGTGGVVPIPIPILTPSPPSTPPPSPCPYPSKLTTVTGILGGIFCVLPGPVQGCTSGTQPTGVANIKQGEFACCPAGDINTPETNRTRRPTPIGAVRPRQRGVSASAFPTANPATPMAAWPPACARCRRHARAARAIMIFAPSPPARRRPSPPGARPAISQNNSALRWGPKMSPTFLFVSRTPLALRVIPWRRTCAWRIRRRRQYLRPAKLPFPAAVAALPARRRRKDSAARPARFPRPAAGVAACGRRRRLPLQSAGQDPGVRAGGA